MPYVANARIYSVNPVAASTWKKLFAWLARESGVDPGVIDHAFPLPLAEPRSSADLEMSRSHPLCGRREFPA
jgi:hypothetical protein